MFPLSPSEILPKTDPPPALKAEVQVNSLIYVYLIMCIFKKGWYYGGGCIAAFSWSISKKTVLGPLSIQHPKNLLLNIQLPESEYPL